MIKKEKAPEGGLNLLYWNRRREEASGVPFFYCRAILFEMERMSIILRDISRIPQTMLDGNSKIIRTRLPSLRFARPTNVGYGHCYSTTGSHGTLAFAAMEVVLS